MTIFPKGHHGDLQDGYQRNKILASRESRFRFVPKDMQFSQAEQIYSTLIECNGQRLAETLRKCQYTRHAPLGSRPEEVWLGTGESRAFQTFSSG